jgi:hypothetical protein
MRSDVHSAALRAAAKVAFSVAFLGGCTAATSPADVGEGDDLDGVEPGTYESDLNTKKANSKPKSGTKGAQVASPCHKDAGAPKLTCEQVVNAAFPTEGDYPGAKQSVSVEVQTCCVELLEKSQGALAEHRWDCCANLPADAGQNINIACTPWGPPVPPQMKRRSKKNAEPMPEAWLQAVA